MRFLRQGLFFLLLLLLQAAGGPAEAGLDSAAALFQTNRLTNPGLEEPYSGGVASGWAPWHQELNSNPKPANCSAAYAVRPSWQPESVSSTLIYDGSRSQHVGNNFDTWRAGIFQTVSGLTAGSRYRFTFYATGRASNEQYPVPSDTAVNLGVRGGIDPNGSGIWSDGDVVWGGSGSPHMAGAQGNWQQFSVEATATGNQVTVFMQGDVSGANQCRAHLDIWFDAAELVEVGPPPTNTSPPLPTQPAATAVPVLPTATPTSEVVATDTPEPTAAPTNTPEPLVGEVCVNAFSDADGNGMHDADEGFMAGVTLTIIQGEDIKYQTISTGSSTPQCFEFEEEGEYVVAQVVPRSLEMTTAPSAAVQVAHGATISLEFGSRIGSAAAEPVAENATAEPTSAAASGGGATTDGGGGLTPLALAGLGAIGLAILLLVGLVVVVLRQQRA